MEIWIWSNKWTDDLHISDGIKFKWKFHYISHIFLFLIRSFHSGVLRRFFSFFFIFRKAEDGKRLRSSEEYERQFWLVNYFCAFKIQNIGIGKQTKPCIKYFPTFSIWYTFYYSIYCLQTITKRYHPSFHIHCKTGIFPNFFFKMLPWLMMMMI